MPTPDDIEMDLLALYRDLHDTIERELLGNGVVAINGRWLTKRLAECSALRKQLES